MEPNLKKILRAVVLELRHILEGAHDDRGRPTPGDLDRRLNQLGVRRDRPAKSVEELPQLSDEDRAARVVVDGYLKLRQEADVKLSDAVGEFVRESAYTWVNRLLALRCMEARGIIDEVILQKDAYGGRSLVHNRLARRDPEAVRGEDDGLFAVLFDQFTERARELPVLFDPESPAVALRPGPAALKRCTALLSGRETVRGQDAATDEVFTAADALGWAYQYWNGEEKDRVFEMVRTRKGAKIEGADIIPATCIYTEPYIVKFLVQNSLGATWMGLHPESRLAERWEYFVRDADRAPVAAKPVSEITFLDPACGSGHFLLEAFELLYSMYEEEGALTAPREIAGSILNENLFGIDIDERATQIAQAALWMKAKEKAPDLAPADLTGFHKHLVAANIRLPKGTDHIEAFLKNHPEDRPFQPALGVIFASLEDAPEIGSLLKIEEPLDRRMRELKADYDQAQAAGAGPQLRLYEQTPVQHRLPVGAETYEAWRDRVLGRLRDHFAAEALAADATQGFFGRYAAAGLALFDLLARRYTIVAANPPYMGSKNIGEALNRHLAAHCPLAKYDLYTSFLLCCRDLCGNTGRFALVTMQSYFYTSRFARLRETLLETAHLELALHIGADAFPEMGDHVLAVCTVWAGAPSHNDAITVLDVRKDRDKVTASRDAASGRAGVRYRMAKEALASLPGMPFLYDLPRGFVALFSKYARIGDYADLLVREGIHSNPDERFQRFWWEVSQRDNRWFRLAVGGARRKWAGLDDSLVDYQLSAARIKAQPSPIVPSEELYGRGGLSYSDAGGSGFSCRELDAGTLFSSTGPAIVSASGQNLSSLTAYLNSTAICFLLDSLNPSNHYKINDLLRLPLPGNILTCGELACLAEAAVDAKKSLLSRQLTSREFRRRVGPASSLREMVCESRKTEWSAQRELVEIERAVDEKIASSLGLDATAQAFLEGTYRPRCLGGKRPDESVLTKVAGFVPRNVRFGEMGHMAFAEYAVEALAFDKGWCARECTERLISELRTALPLSACRPVLCDYVMAIVLQLLGHRWPGQVEADEPVPNWVDRDGIVALTEGTNEKSVLQRIRERFVEEFTGGSVQAIETEFEEFVGTPLGAWLAGEFFRRHVSQFKKRPIAWQLVTSAPGRGRRTGAGDSGPVFSCLAYCHKLDADLLPKVRSQYVGTLRSRFQTELTTLERLTEPTADQASRKVQLANWIDELKSFDEALGGVVAEGFSTSQSKAALRQNAIDDAMLCLKQRWLRRLTEMVQQEALAAWRTDADATELHPELPAWVEESVEKLHHHCSAVGPAAPANPPADPEAAALAAMICPEHETMVADALKLACDEWRAKLDEAIVKPLKAKLKALRDSDWGAAGLWDSEGALAAGASGAATLPALGGNAEEKGAAQVVGGDRREPSRAEVSLHRKALKAEIERVERAAGGLAARIRQWTCPEAAGWQEWLSAEPMYDEISSVDGRRAPPGTVAEFVAQEIAYIPDINDGVRVNIAPLQRAGLLAADVLVRKDVDKAIADRAEWRADERRWCREGKLPRPGWWESTDLEGPQR